MTFVLRTHNVRHRMPAKFALPAIEADVAEADVAALQEVANRLGTLTELAAERKLINFLPPIQPARALPIVADPAKFEQRGYGSFHLSEPRFVGRAGAGRASTTGVYVATYLTLLEVETDRVFSVVNWHGVASVQIDVRDELSEDQVEALAEGCKMLRRFGPVALVGDANMRPDHENLEPLRRAGFWCANQDGPHTFKGRTIDHGWLWGDIACDDVAVHPPAEPGEHKPVDFTLTLTGKR
jgi:endonuclease/exonuclease/phosphatase family metal-dependent hydrolase